MLRDASSTIIIIITSSAAAEINSTFSATLDITWIVAVRNNTIALLYNIYYINILYTPADNIMIFSKYGSYFTLFINSIYKLRYFVLATRATRKCDFCIYIKCGIHSLFFNIMKNENPNNTRNRSSFGYNFSFFNNGKYYYYFYIIYDLYYVLICNIYIVYDLNAAR